MHKWIPVCFLLLLCNTVAAQPIQLPEEATAFILPGYEMLDYVPGDINSDGKPDAVLVLKQQGEDSIDTDLTRPLLLLERQADGKLKKVDQNDSAVLCLHCGGVFGDPYEGINIIKNGFTLSFYGGSNWRWSYLYTFSYSQAKNTWFLSRLTETNYHTMEPEKSFKKITVNKSELGEISIAVFNINFNAEETKWKVTAAKTFFYNNPRLGSKPRKAYLLKGNIVTVYKQYKNFVQVYFRNKVERSSSGFILKKDLVKIE